MTRVLIPSGALGLDYDKSALARGVAMQPDLIAIDGGSTDSGPSYLGRGVSKYSRASTKIEWKGLIDAARQAGCPLVIGTAGTCGTDSTVDWLLEITRECLAELNLTAKIATLKCEQSPDHIATAFDAGRITPLPAAPQASTEIIQSCTHIVALAGAEQITKALNTGADIIIAGRTTDTAIIAALPIQQGANPGAAWHGAKIGECGALCATNPQSGVLMVEFDDTGFTVHPLAEGARATPADGRVRSRRLFHMSEDAVVETLTEIKGVGPWTAHMILMFSLGRPDVLPVGDYGVRKGAQLLYGLGELPKPAALEALAEPWRPYASVASWYLWRATEIIPPG